MLGIRAGPRCDVAIKENCFAKRSQPVVIAPVRATWSTMEICTVGKLVTRAGHWLLLLQVEERGVQRGIHTSYLSPWLSTARRSCFLQTPGPSRHFPRVVSSGGAKSAHLEELEVWVLGSQSLSLSHSLSLFARQAGQSILVLVVANSSPAQVAMRSGNQGGSDQGVMGGSDPHPCRVGDSGVSTWLPISLDQSVGPRQPAQWNRTVEQRELQYDIWAQGWQDSGPPDCSTRNVWGAICLAPAARDSS
ncbi:hypothetical protein EGW08_015674 [Elysia chlorotica]|uniref:Uncharacterized protein n=1 Tax=Elysia chlorotica TaxID=188477 RepID=A0A3S0ZVY1_ELYCH|nr:hypothetical protein EGW08_015674 [Elysia chlorotica]